VTANGVPRWVYRTSIERLEVDIIRGEYHHSSPLPIPLLPPRGGMHYNASPMIIMFTTYRLSQWIDHAASESVSEIRRGDSWTCGSRL
jgi:hypothetical protein